MLTKEDWLRRPKHCRHTLLTDLSRKLAVASHPCTDPAGGSDCPHPGEDCTFKQLWMMRKAIAEMPIEDLVAANLLEIEKSEAMPITEED